MDRVARNEEQRWNVGTVFQILSTQRTLNHAQRLRLKEDGRPCPAINFKHRTSESVYGTYPWICGDKEKNTFFCWPCLVMGDLSKVIMVMFFSC